MGQKSFTRVTTLDVPKVTPDPKILDQPRYEATGSPTQNGLFADWVDKTKMGSVDPARFTVYEKMIVGVWTDRGPFRLVGYTYPSDGSRRVFKFILHQLDSDIETNQDGSGVELSLTRQIPSSVKQFVYKRDHGKCVLCGASDQLQFDHDFPFSKGGTSVLPENVRILCARHNLEKGASIT